MISDIQVIVRIMENGEFKFQLFGYGSLMYFLSK